MAQLQTRRNKETSEAPVVVLVGPTNVGKSALFNRLTRSRTAIVCDRPGVTVDRHEKVSDSPDLGTVKFVDTGGVGAEALKHPLGKEIERAAGVALGLATVILFVVDGTRELGASELEIAQWIRKKLGRKNTPVWLIANKSDSSKHDSASYFSLGLERYFDVSAEHDVGILELREALRKQFTSSNTSFETSSVENFEFQESDQSERSEDDMEKPPRILVLGRPNVGKSTLLNQILGEERHVVSPMAGTTRDPIESTLKVESKGIEWKLVDTPGLRQPGRLERNVEWVAREKLKEEARDADIALVLVEANTGITDLDASIAGLALDFGLSVVLVLNKWDLMTQGDAEEKWNHLQRTGDLKLDFVKWCPKVKMSGLTGKGIPELIKTVKKVIADRRHRVQTSQLNEVFEKKIRLHSHPIGDRGRPAKFYYLSQVSSNPPEFVLFSNLSGKEVHFSYRRFIGNTLRKEFGFLGCPIKLHFKTAQ